MTKAYSKPKNSKTKAAKDEPRHYTVGYINVRHEPKASDARTHYSKHPALHLKGNWLNELGFTTGQPVTITAKKGKLIVKIAK